MPKTILLVDDQDLIIRVLQATLRTIGATIASARNGEEALRFIEEKTLPDAMILDYSMPNMDGVETLRRIRKLPGGDSIPVLMLTARDQTLIRQAAEGLQVADFMTKPFSPVALQKVMRELLEKNGENPNTKNIPDAAPASNP